MKAFLVEKTFPKSAEDMTLKLSNVTAAFYGLTLANIGERFGWREADAISKAVFRKLGQLKTKEALELGVDLPRDSRAPVLVFITAVHSASPEYNFEVLEYLPDETTIRVFGISRYDRIAKTLNIERHLTWPELLPFFEGAAEELGIKCKVRRRAQGARRARPLRMLLPNSPVKDQAAIRQSPREPFRRAARRL